MTPLDKLSQANRDAGLDYENTAPEQDHLSRIKQALEAVENPCPEGFTDEADDVRRFIVMGSRRNALRVLEAACNPTAMKEVLRHIDDLKARLEAAERDAELLKMLYENIEHDGHGYWGPDFPVNGSGNKAPTMDEFRAAIDFYFADKDTNPINAGRT